MRNRIKNVVLFLGIIALTAVLLKIPRKIYEMQDEVLFQEVEQFQYDIHLVNESMSIRQKIDALLSDDAFVVSQYNFTKDVFPEYSKELVKEAEKLLGSTLAQYVQVIMDKMPGVNPAYMENADAESVESMQYVVSEYRIMQVVEQEVYAFNLGCVLWEGIVRNRDGYEYYGSFRLLFDVDSHEIFFLDLEGPMELLFYEDTALTGDNLYQYTMEYMDIHMQELSDRIGEYYGSENLCSVYWDFGNLSVVFNERDGKTYRSSKTISQIEESVLTSLPYGEIIQE